MDPPDQLNRSDRIRDLFDEVAGLPPEARASRLNEVCGGDVELRREVESLLAAHDAGHTDVDGMLRDVGAGEESAATPSALEQRLRESLAGRYRVEREIGEGGMATVYLAHDLKHDRQVALKVLKPELAIVVGADRFLAEIKTTANLRHPHILPLFDSGLAEGFLYYVMPYVEGENLRERLDRERQLPVDDAVGIATNVAEALDYAHRQGVVHRDIKPSNVLLLDGKPVISDFGIALAVSALAGGRLTETGLSLGTPHYMSPEQATGDERIGPATDLYALGCVLYEMLVGEPPHTGSTPQVVLGKIIAGEAPSARGERSSVPANVDAAIRKALEKLPADRFPSTAAFKLALEDPAFRLGVDAPAARDSRLVRVLSGALVITSALALWGWLGLSDPAPQRRVTALDVPQVPELAGARSALSPPGDAVVVQAGERLWLRNLGEPDFHEVSGTEGASGPFWSPDGAWIGFFRSTGLAKVSREGGSPQTLAELNVYCCPSESKAVWLEDGRIVFSPALSDLFVVSEDGGPVETLLAAAEGEHFHQFMLLPSGEVAIEIDPDNAPGRVDLWNAQSWRNVTWGEFPVYSETGHVLYARGGDLWAVPYSDRRHAEVGPPFLVLQDAVPLGVGRDGSLLAWREGQLERALVWVDRTGSQRGAFDEVDGNVQGLPKISSDGLVAYQVGERIWVLDPERGVRRPLTENRATLEAWSADGRRLYYSVTEPGEERSEGHLAVLDLTSDMSIVLADPGADPSESPDGRYVAFRIGDPGYHELRVLDLADDDLEPGPFQSSPGSQKTSPAISPRGGWIAYRAAVRTRIGQNELWVSRFPSGEEPTLVSSDVRATPRWSPDGSRLYFVRRSDGALMEIEVSYDAEGVTLSPPRVLFHQASPGLNLGVGFELSQDGELFLGVRQVTPRGGISPSLILVQNWLDGRTAR